MGLFIDLWNKRFGDKHLTRAQKDRAQLKAITLAERGRVEREKAIAVSERDKLKKRKKKHSHLQERIERLTTRQLGLEKTLEGLK